MVQTKYILTLYCRDQLRIVAAVSTVLASCEAFIIESSHFGDADTDLFFMRTMFRTMGSRFVTESDFNQALAPVAKRYDMVIRLYTDEARTKAVIAVSRHAHCLNHLLHQWHAGELPLDVVAVVSNHDDLRRMVDWYGIPFHHLPIENGNRPVQEAHIMELLAVTGA